jgi:general secretion pathway protein F
VIAAGEQSGSPGPRCWSSGRRQAVRSGFGPAIVTLIAIVIVMFLVGYNDLPQVANVFARTKRALPFLTG